MKNISPGVLIKVMPVLLAWAKGKLTQHFANGVWEDMGYLNLETIADMLNEPDKYRVRPDMAYRPFENREEMVKEMKNHKPFGWINTKDETGYLIAVDYIHEKCFSLSNELVFRFRPVDDDPSSADAFRDYTFMDGSPFGINDYDV